jgi:hypothetical protein
VGHTLVIQGAGPSQTIIDAGTLDRAFEVFSNVTVIFRNLSIVNGQAVEDGTDGATNATSDAFGGGILNQGGNVTLDNVHIADCKALGGPGRAAAGGGIYSSGGSPTLLNSTFQTDNAFGSAGVDGTFASPAGGNGGNGQGGDAQGGGLFAGNATVNVSNATFTQNETDAKPGFGAGGTGGNFGAGIDNGAPGQDGHGGNAGLTQGGGLFAGSGTMNVHNSTVASNAALSNQGGGGGSGVPALGGNGSLGQGGGVFIGANASFATVSSIFALDFVNGGATDADISSPFGAFLAADHCLVGNNKGTALLAADPDGNGNIVGTPAAPIDPKLGPLQDNGGPTETMALLPGSPALNTGSNPDGLSTDQRGYGPRNAGGGVDIGAFQLGARPVPPSPPPAPVVHGVAPRVVSAHHPRLLEVFDAQTGALRFAVYPFGKGFGGNFSVATADINGDGFADVIVTTVLRAGRRRFVPVTAIFSGLNGARLA